MLDGAAEGPERFLVQPRPAFLVGLPSHFAKALARVLERYHKRIRSSDFTVRQTGWRALTLVDLRLLAGQGGEDIEEFWRARL